jgi:hypothetical protein
VTPHVVLSPHPDDAVLSAWHVLVSPHQLQVVTIFAGIPTPGFVTRLDQAHGATDSAAWMRRRLADDRASLALAGRRPHHLDLVEVQYRAHQALQRVTAEELHSRLQPFIHPEAVVYFPCGIGGHPDHGDVAGTMAWWTATGHQVRLYGDTPYYFVRHGLPSWVGGTANPRADAMIEAALAALPNPPDRLSRHVVELTPTELARKQQAIRRYRTEAAALHAELSTAPSDPAMLRYEVHWAVG